MASYKLSEEAKSDLKSIYRYGVANFGEKQADKYFHAFFIRFQQIADQPYLYPSVEHIREGYRRSVCGSDAIYYRVVKGGVEIMAIIGRQDNATLKAGA